MRDALNKKTPHPTKELGRHRRTNARASYILPPLVVNVAFLSTHAKPGIG
jgi:hypothetical protein